MPSLALAFVLAQQTTTTAVPRAVGDPLPPWVMILLGIGMLVVVLAGGLALRQVAKRSG